jgi:hypothetical protein
MRRSRRSSAHLPDDLRLELAVEAARFMAEHGIEDYGLAKRKAAERLGVRAGAGAMPSNELVHAQLLERQRIFEPEGNAERLAHLRRIATDVMAVLEPFRPRLVGAVLDGSATVNTAIELHAFSDAPESVAAALEERGFRLRDSQRRYRFGRDDSQEVPGFGLHLDGEDLEVMVFRERGSAHAPLSPVDGKPMRRASRSAVMALLDPAY